MVREARLAVHRECRIDSLRSNNVASLTVPNTGGWQAYTTVFSNPFSLAAGAHTLKVFGDTSSGTCGVGNLKWFAVQ